MVEGESFLYEFWFCFGSGERGSETYFLGDILRILQVVEREGGTVPFFVSCKGCLVWYQLQAGGVGLGSGVTWG